MGMYKLKKHIIEEMVIKLLTFLLLMLFSLPVMMPEPVYDVGGYEGTVEKLESLGEKPNGEYEGVDEEELHCLSVALYKEVRGEPEKAIIVVAQTILNRTEHRDWPDSVCDVVKQKIKGRCQFSWWCTANRLVIKDIKSYNRLNKISFNALTGKYKGMSTSHYFKRCDVNNKFFDKLEFRGKIGATCFYREFIRRK